MKLLVCGDRDWKDYDAIYRIVQRLQPLCIIEGGGSGADAKAMDVAACLGIPRTTVSAEWNIYGRAAGPIRNQKMIDMHPDLVVAFHSDITKSAGTMDTLCRAEDNGIPYALVEG